MAKYKGSRPVKPRPVRSYGTTAPTATPGAYVPGYGMTPQVRPQQPPRPPQPVQPPQPVFVNPAYPGYGLPPQNGRYLGSRVPAGRSSGYAGESEASRYYGGVQQAGRPMTATEAANMATNATTFGQSNYSYGTPNAPIHTGPGVTGVPKFLNQTPEPPLLQRMGTEIDPATGLPYLVFPPMYGPPVPPTDWFLENQPAAEEPVYEDYGSSYSPYPWYDYGGGGGGSYQQNYQARNYQRTLPATPRQSTGVPYIARGADMQRGFAGQPINPARWQQLLTTWRV